MNSSIDDPINGTQAFKASMRAQWDTAAPGWNAHTTDIRAWLHKPTDAMCRMAGVRAGLRVLDVAAGSGDQTLAVAQAVGAQGYVLATDLSPAIAALARDNAIRAGFANVETRVADGEDLGVPEASFDAAVCRLGLMFFPDPLRGLREMHRALRPGGGVCTMVFSRPEKNPCLTILMSTALKHAGLPARDPFLAGGLLSLGQPGRIDALFRSAGFHDVATTALDAPFCLPSVDHYLAFVRSSASPILQILRQLDAASAEAAWSEMRDRLVAFGTQDGWEGPNELLLTAGRRPEEAT
ncbi:class I SAM-dependent methyltransferase [Variovorax paradoxus]|nr:class I SAM-dependent methyltransferase [Variovorax paradoxus]MBT2303161.1 class I SAM-dependent methyltransferase [Variovorax paradoxus]